MKKHTKITKHLLLKIVISFYNLITRKGFHLVCGSKLIIMSTAEQIKAQYEAFVEENEKFVTKGNKAAAGRARKALSELAKLCKARRAEILEEKK